jgi:hypothetical protein
MVLRSTERGAIKLIRAGVERCVTPFDTAEIYSPFTNEESPIHADRGASAFNDFLALDQQADAVTDPRL